MRVGDVPTFERPMADMEQASKRADACLRQGGEWTREMDRRLLMWIAQFAEDYELPPRKVAERVARLS